MKRTHTNENKGFTIRHRSYHWPLRDIAGDGGHTRINNNNNRDNVNQHDVAAAVVANKRPKYKHRNSFISWRGDAAACRVAGRWWCRPGIGERGSGSFAGKPRVISQSAARTDTLRNIIKMEFFLVPGLKNMHRSGVPTSIDRGRKPCTQKKKK